MSEPIFAALEQKLERGWDAFTDHLPRAHYHQPVTTATPATEAPAMSLATIIAEAEKDAATIDHGIHNFINGHLPALGQLAASVENSELFQVALGLVGTLDPAVESMAVTVLKALAANAPAPVAVAAVADPAMGQQAEPAPLA